MRFEGFCYLGQAVCFAAYSICIGVHQFEFDFGVIFPFGLALGSSCLCKLHMFVVVGFCWVMVMGFKDSFLCPFSIVI